MSRELGELGGGSVGMAVGAQYRGDELTYDYDENANRDNFLFLTGNPDFGDDRDVERRVRRARAAVQRDAEPAAGRPLRGLRRRRRLDGPEGHAALAAVARSSRCAPRSARRSARRRCSKRSARRRRSPSSSTPTSAAPQFFPVRTQPNPSGAALSPEEADVFNVGVSFSPTEDWEIGVDYWSFDYTNVIIEQNAQAILNAAAQGNAQARAQVIRDAGERPAAARRLVLRQRLGARDRRLRSAAWRASSSSAAAAR